nr:tetratricopeptide repeat protein 7B-like [Aedes albopictus]
MWATASSAEQVSDEALESWRMKKMRRQQFIPRNQDEETVLLLLIAEALAVRDAVLSQNPETVIYNLMILATVRWNQADSNDFSVKALKFTFWEDHNWQQYAVCLIAMGHYKHVVRALKEHSNQWTVSVA